MSLETREIQDEEPRSFKDEALDQTRLALPICAGLLSTQVVNLVSTVLVGRLGARDLAAASLAVSLANVSGYSVIVGVASTLQTTAGQAFGARNFEEVSLSLQRCMLLCAVFLCIVAALWFNSHSLLLLGGQEEAIAAMAAQYLHILLPGLCCFVVTQCLQNWLAGQRVTGVQGSSGFVLAVVHLPLCWLLVQQMGYLGAAVATSMGNCLRLIWVIYKTRRALRDLSQSWQGWSRKALQGWPSFLRLALPNFLMISEWWAAEIIVLLAGTLPNAEANLTAMAIFSNTCSLCFYFPCGLGMATNTRVSNELGAGRAHGARAAMRVSMLLGLGLVMLTSLAVLLGRHGWLRLFTADRAVDATAEPVLQVASAYVVFDGLTIVVNGALKGCGRQMIQAPIVVASYYLLGLPIAWLLAWPEHLATLGLALGALVGTAANLLGFLWLILATDWHLMVRRAQERAGAKPLLESSSSSLGG
ncbi:Protein DETOXIFICATION 10 (AtDTX10) (Multidrug and toxic compound extrusion protein 10) (MATE protein 10) [Durusdinium trenchii]|uniref:Protein DETOXIFICATION 10 (AtDTX10) (Multidrug and toxic compound extrusion protein 10) (MATE protein 10) n=1 Tax=Durusdinium trenchii TaxID=1381693 RepID=A0ABP0QP68_9DINO